MAKRTRNNYTVSFTVFQSFTVVRNAYFAFFLVGSSDRDDRLESEKDSVKVVPSVPVARFFRKISRCSIGRETSD